MPEAAWWSDWQWGRQFLDQGHAAEAWDCFQGVLDAEPGFVPAWVMLGNLALDAGEPDLAIEYWQGALKLAPAEQGLWLSIGQACREQGQLDAAIEAYTRYLDAYGEDADAWLLLARCYHARYWTFHEARCLERCAQLRPQDARILRWQGMIRFYFGDWDWLKPYFLRVLPQIDPLGLPAGQSRPAGSDSETGQESGFDAEIARLFALDYQRYLFTDPQIDDQALFAWIRICQNSEPASQQRVWPVKASGPLRVGYLSGEFGNFASALLVWPLYLNQGADIEMYVYDDTHPDHATHDFRPPTLHWRRVYGWHNQAVIDQIAADGIDVLVDLTGITHQQRHGVYASHPAPVQVSGLGFVFSSGLACMDYCFSDKVLCPPQIEALYPEKVIHLTSAFHWKHTEAFRLTDPPFCQNGYLTLGAAHTLNRLQPEVIALWARILTALPTARLFLKTAVLADPLTQQLYLERFATHGIGPERLRLEGPGSGHHVSYFYPQIDIALDPFPYSGGVTTSEALWMGVPVVVMDQPQWRSRALSVSLYHTLGLQDWLAKSEADYLARVLAWSADPDFLCSQRQALRPRLLASPICDGAAYAREVETAFDWMRSQASQPSDRTAGRL